MGERYQKDNRFVETDDNGRFEFNAIPRVDISGIRLGRPGSLSVSANFYPVARPLESRRIAIREGRVSRVTSYNYLKA